MKIAKKFLSIFIVFVLALNIVFGLSVGYEIPTYDTQTKQDMVDYPIYKTNLQVKNQVYQISNFNLNPRTISFNPADPTVNDDVLCLVNGEDPSDFDRVSIDWLKNGNLITSENPLSKTRTNVDDVWVCKASLTVQGMIQELGRDSVKILAADQNQNEYEVYNGRKDLHFNQETLTLGIEQPIYELDDSVMPKIDIPEAVINKPNLMIESVSFTPQNPKKGTEVKFEVTIKNIGNSDVSSYVFSHNLLDENLFWAAGQQFVDETMPELKAGESKQVIVKMTWSDTGKKTAIFIVDRADAVEETNENDNREEVEVEVLSDNPQTNDTEAPVVTLVSPNDGESFTFDDYFDSLIAFEYKAEDNTDSTLSCDLIIDSERFQDSSLDVTLQNPQPRIEFVEFEEGTYTWNVECTDSEGNTGSGTERSFTVTLTNDNQYYDRDDADDTIDDAKDALDDADQAIEDAEDALDDDLDVPFDDDDVDNAKDDYKDADDLLDKAKEAFDNGDYDSAVEYAEQAIEDAEDILDDLYFYEDDFIDDVYDSGYDNDYTYYDDTDYDSYFNQGNDEEDDQEIVIQTTVPDQEVEEKDSIFKSTGFLVIMIIVIFALIIAEAAMIIRMVRNKKEDDFGEIPDLE